MSFRREPRTLDERVAAIEQQLRQAQASIAGENLGTGIDPSIIDQVGDLIVGIGPGEAGRLAAGAPGSVLTAGGGPSLAWVGLPASASQADLDDLQMLVWLGGPS